MTDPTYEIRQSQYSHPEQTSSQHTNGPPNAFIRKLGGPWHLLPRGTHNYQVQQMIEAIGVDEFLRTRCRQLEEPRK